MNLIVLVHGTQLHFWKPTRTRKKTHPAWFEEGASFRTRVEQALPAGLFRISLRSWSGGNRFRSRHAAATALRKQLGTRNYSSELVIAHSHGGNIALSAVQGKSLEGTAVVTIGTPFLTLSKRRASIFEILGYGLILVPLLMCLILLGGRLEELLPKLDFGSSFLGRTGQFLTFLAMIPVFIILVILAAGIIILLVMALRRKLERIRENISDRAVVSKAWRAGSNKNPLHCVYCAADEAYWLLKVYSNVINGYYFALLGTYAAITFLYLMPFFWDFKLFMIDLVFGEMGRDIALTPVPVSKYSKELRSSIIAVNAVFMLAAMALYFATYAIYVLLHLPFILSEVSFGLRDLPSALRSRISVTQIPINYKGHLSVTKVPMGLSGWSKLQLNHSAIIDRDETISKILQTINNIELADTRTI